MSLPGRYDPQISEPRLQAFWHEAGVYRFSAESQAPVYSIDTPPPTVSGKLHLGHAYSYSHADFVARYRRMCGYNVYYPMGYDDNGLPTDRLVERILGIKAIQVGRLAFINKCLEVSEEAEVEYQALWQRLGLSVDWRFTYRTIDDASRKIAQLSFLDLYKKGLVYRRQAPVIWCPECRTAIAQADLNDLERGTEFVTLRFDLVNGGAGGRSIQIATTRPELLPACVAVFVHPQDSRYSDLIGSRATVPIFGQTVPILADPAADPEKGTGAVMCCTFGDATDVAWWFTHKLPLMQAIDASGCLTQVAGEYAGLTIRQARQKIKNDLESKGFQKGRESASQTIRVHERCDTPVEYLVSWQWFIHLLENKQALRQAGEEVRWFPEQMRARYSTWVENLNWDWCISRQRFYGVPFPVWYCQECGNVILAEKDQLPVDPLASQPKQPCGCGSTSFIPEEDVMDTWAISSLSPQIAGDWLKNRPWDGGDALYEKVFPFSLRPQAHEIIRTWAFYTIAKSQYHFNALPWKDALISGWAIAGEGMGKISKSRGGGPMSPQEMIERYSADAIRYWAASTGPGKDAVISEEKIGMGSRLVTKLWNVARFSERFLGDDIFPHSIQIPALTPADRWILARLQSLVRQATAMLEGYDYAAAKSLVEAFFWRELADNYLEMVKQRLYDPASSHHLGACFSLYQLLLTVLKLFAPFIPYVTEEIYQSLFLSKEWRWVDGNWNMSDNIRSIHLSPWPRPIPELESEQAEAFGETLMGIASAVRRYKSERNLALNTELDSLQLAPVDGRDMELLREAVADLLSITRAKKIEIVGSPDTRAEAVLAEGPVHLGIIMVHG